MHILIVPSWYPASPADPGGSFFREQAIALARAGLRVGVTFPNFRSLKHLRRSLGEPAGVQVENDEGVQTYRLQALNWAPRIPVGIHRQWITRGLRLFKAYLAAEGSPDVIHAHSMLFGGALAIEIKRRYGIPVVVTEHSTGYAKRVLSPFELRCAASIAQATDRNLAVSDQFVTLLSNLFPDSTAPWQTMPNMVNQAFLQQPRRQRVAGGFRFINVALLNKTKRHANLIRAFAAAFKLDPDTTLEIAGDGPERAALQALIDELGLQSRVTLLGSVPRARVPTLLDGADAFVLSSNYETFGVVVVEALALGLPVVATACGGPDSIVTPDDGLLVEVDNIDQLSHAMQTVRQQIVRFDSNAIRARCAARYGEPAIVQRLMSIYRELIAPSDATY